MKKLILLLFLFGQLLAQNTQQTIGVSTGDGGGINSNNIGSNGGNTLTSDVDGLIDTARLINTNILTWNSIDGLFTSTINGVAATVTIPRVSQAFPIQNGVLNTRTGAIGTAGTNIFAAWDHQHPLVALAIPALANVAIAGSGGALVSQAIVRQRSTEETVTYTLQVRTSNTAATAWMTIICQAL